MKNSANSRNAGQAGFSLPELMMVVLIIIVVSSIAVPALLNAIADVKLRSAASTLQGHIQQLRMRAIKDNKAMKAKLTTQSGSILMYVDVDGGDDYDTDEPTVSFPPTVAVPSSGGPTLTTAEVANISTFVVGTSSNAIYFNARGLPCDTSVNAACQTLKGYVYYLSQPRTTGGTAYAAVSVTPGGRIKVWRRQGNTWQ
ncbi:MAG TPA: GspH/FimT family pseudopilin [Terriglobales bacterium]|nr:GspH/FimT family pseudopilin [Terriglobales bacterium]